jgi:hypothetical protein
MYLLIEKVVKAMVKLRGSTVNVEIEVDGRTVVVYSNNGTHLAADVYDRCNDVHDLEKALQRLSICRDHEEREEIKGIASGNKCMRRWFYIHVTITTSGRDVVAPVFF